jgi:hypothetical protein
MPLPASLISEQTMQVGTNGPGDVTSMHVISGIAQASLSAFAPSGSFVTQQATFAVLVGPNDHR